MNENEQEEIWKDVPEFEGLYQVSNLGRVKSLERLSAPALGYGPGGRRRHIPEKMLRQSLVVGYPRVGLCKNGKYTHFLVHQLVLRAFVGPCPEGMQARHYPNQDRRDARLSNLSWATVSVNHMDKVENGTCTGGPDYYYLLERRQKLEARDASTS